MEYQGKVLITTGNGEPWELPGGRIHYQEQPIDGLKREVMEELGIQIEPLTVYGVDVFTSKSGNHHFMVFYLCQPLTDAKEIKFVDGEVTDMRWVDETELEDIDMRPQYKDILRRFFQSRD